MTSTWTNLLWKEWREHAGTMLALCVIAVATPIGVSIWSPELVVGNAATVLTLLIPLAAMFLGMGAASSEQSRGTIRFLQALPTPMSRPAGAKLLVAIATIAAPLVAGVVGCTLFHTLFVGGDYEYRPFNGFNPVWGISNWQVGAIVAGLLGGGSLLVWMAALGANHTDEVRAGAVGLLAIVGAWAIAAFLLLHSSEVGRDALNPTWFRILAAALPGGAGVPETGQSTPGWWSVHWPFALAALVSNGAMAAWYLARFGRVAARRGQPTLAAPAVAPPGWLQPPCRTPLGAMLWKQARETLPLALMGAVVIPVVALTLVQFKVMNPDGQLAQGVATMVVVIWTILGSFVAIVAGVGLFMDDLKPGLHAFWRSRPVNVDHWFWVKVAAGGAFTLALLAVPGVLGGVYLQATSPPIELQNVPSHLVLGLVIHFGMFAAAVAAITLVRQPIYSAILALGAAAFTGAVADWMDRRFLVSESAILTSVVIAAFFALVAAWLTVRNDWGWKG